MTILGADWGSRIQECKCGNEGAYLINGVYHCEDCIEEIDFDEFLGDDNDEA